MGVWDSLTRHALLRADRDALAWLLHPPAGFPAWEEDPLHPILNRALQDDLKKNIPLRTRQIAYLLNEGVRPRITPHPTDPHAPGSSPLQIMLDAYEAALDITAKGFVDLDEEGNPIEPNEAFGAMVTQLWPLLVAAGDDPDRLLQDGRTARDMVMATPQAGVAMAYDRLRQSGPSPQHRRSRLRS
jgi:hypothetical protein